MKLPHLKDYFVAVRKVLCEKKIIQNKITQYCGGFSAALSILLFRNFICFDCGYETVKFNYQLKLFTINGWRFFFSLISYKGNFSERLTTLISPMINYYCGYPFHVWYTSRNLINVIYHFLAYPFDDESKYPYFCIESQIQHVVDKEWVSDSTTHLTLNCYCYLLWYKIIFLALNYISRFWYWLVLTTLVLVY